MKVKKKNVVKKCLLVVRRESVVDIFEMKERERERERERESAHDTSTSLITLRMRS